ncbi:MAG TPA: zinc-binding dehydrogenase [Acidimicrobiales bacterium]|nr:zinc-binding dehydrogenase [Acidimicrobiales bacterium]
MHALTINQGRIDWVLHPDPAPGPGQILVEVHAAGVNAADLLQRDGFYPAPAGSPPDIPGLELAGKVMAVGPGTGRFAVGDRVMAVVGGGAQAELIVVDESHAMAVPHSMGWDEAGGFPEAFSTAYDALVTQCGLMVGDRVLVTGAAGGVGTAAVQLAAAAGASVVASVRDASLLDAVLSLGATHALSPDEAAGRGPFDVVLELVSGPSFATSLAALATGGRLSVIGVGGGASAEIDLLTLMQRRARVHGSTLRARSSADKAFVAREVEAHVVPLVARGRVRVPIVERMALSQGAEAYARFAQGAKFGKVVLVRA